MIQHNIAIGYNVLVRLLFRHQMIDNLFLYDMLVCMWVDADRLTNFYRSMLGSLVHQAVSQKVADVWSTSRHQTVVGYGYAIPYLGLFDGEADRVISLMPAPQGVKPWPKDRPNCSLLIDETLFPFEDASVNKIIIVHAFEYSKKTYALLRECWRVLVDGGDLLIITPNRRGAWAQMTNSPLGYGTPYTGHQLYDVIEQSGFDPLKPLYCLYTPPSEQLFRHRFAKTFEKVGHHFYRKLGGMLLFPSRKKIYALTARRQGSTLPKVFRPSLNSS